MQKEIFEQPTVIGDTLQSFLHPLNRTVELPDLGIDLAAIPRITIPACGPAYFARLVATYWLEPVARQPVEVDITSAFRYREAPRQSGGPGPSLPPSGQTIHPPQPRRH